MHDTISLLLMHNIPVYYVFCLLYDFLYRVVLDICGPTVPGSIHNGTEPEAVCVEAAILRTAMEHFWYPNSGNIYATKYLITWDGRKSLTNTVPRLHHCSGQPTGLPHPTDSAEHRCV